jgi:hypothetical protein
MPGPSGRISISGSSVAATWLRVDLRAGAGRLLLATRLTRPVVVEKSQLSWSRVDSTRNHRSTMTAEAERSALLGAIQNCVDASSNFNLSANPRLLSDVVGRRRLQGRPQLSLPRFTPAPSASSRLPMAPPPTPHFFHPRLSSPSLSPAQI